MSHQSIAENLYLIDLDQTLTGFRKFISSWLYLGPSTTFLVDPGPSYSIDHLLQTLEKIPVPKLDFILLTHIHIDHAGGTGKLLERYPDATVICHPKAIEHMVNPEKLWQGSVKVLGDIALAYGPIIPVAPDRIRFEERLEIEEGTIAIIMTPGHAIHHISFHYNDWLFAGEAAGVRHASKAGVYSRPATPPVFKLEISLASLDTIIALQPKQICLGHYGYVENPSSFLREARKQLLTWITIIKTEFETGGNDVLQRAIARLKNEDPLIRVFEHLEHDIQQRETYFLANSVKGIIHYLEQQAKSTHD